MKTLNYRERRPPAGSLASANRQLLIDIDDVHTLAQGIVDTIRDPLLVLDEDLRVVAANRAFYQMFGMTRQNIEDRPVYALGDGQWNIPALRFLLENIAPYHTVMEAYEVERDFPGIGRFARDLANPHARPEALTDNPPLHIRRPYPMTRPRPPKPGTAHKVRGCLRPHIYPSVSLSQNQKTTLRDSQIDHTNTARNQRGIKRRLQKNGHVRQWAKRGTRPRQPADQRYDNAYLFGAICPARGVGAAPWRFPTPTPT